MQSYSFIISLLIVSSLHASFLVWGAISNTAKAKLTATQSSNSISINVKAISKSSHKEVVKAPLIKKGPHKERLKKKLSNKESTPALSKGQKGANAKAKLLGSLRPEYPHLSKVYEEEGIVSLEALIAPSGDVKDVKLIESSGYQRLDSTAINELKKAKFTPATLNGMPIKSTQVIKINFSLQ